MANLKGMIKKLQMAILQNGIVIKINSFQFYSSEQNRMITKYTICTPITYYSDKKKEWREGDHVIISTCSQIDIIQCLSDVYKVVKK